MDYVRITSIEDTLFIQMHQLMQAVFPPEEVLAFELWREPIQDPDIRVFVAVHEGNVVGATEYRYVQQLQVAMTDFTIIGQPGLGIGRFLYKQRELDLKQVSAAADQPIVGMFAEIYNPYLVQELTFGGVAPMNPIVRREVLSHIGYQKLDFPYVHPSWGNDGEPVDGLDFSFLPANEQLTELPSQLIVDFLTWYYRVLPNKPQAWYDMIEQLKQLQTVALLPL